MRPQSLVAAAGFRHPQECGDGTLELPIDRLKQKVPAAHAAGLADVILPERNRADLEGVLRRSGRR